ncbi:short-chain collagen C4-like [Watersipora subatra]|uniref:short-chain collagen C4-like n=1 Tax=Watersipora subatra TaxID=2589382 RepID=UPI00355B0E5F
MMVFLCDSNPVEENEVVVQLQADVEDLKGMFASMKTFIEEAIAGNNPWEEKVGQPGPPGPPGVTGRDGRDGAKGENGVDGKDGADGRDGDDGLPGRDGRDGERGVTGNPGEPGKEGQDGSAGEPGPKGNPGDAAGGAVYTRWGHTACGSDAELIYEGFSGGTPSDNRGGGGNYQCMVNDAEYKSDITVGLYFATLAGTEYQSSDSGIFDNSVPNHNAPCAVCHTKTRSSVIMIPGKRSCPNNEWTFEYEGYLMSGYFDRDGRTTFVCVDASPETVDGESADDEGALWYFNKAVCSKGVPCPPYNSNKAITCVVCTN